MRRLFAAANTQWKPPPVHVCQLNLSLIKPYLTREGATCLFNSLWESIEREFRPDADDIERRSIDIKEALSLAKAQADRQNQQLQSRKHEEGSKAERLKSYFPWKSNPVEAWQAQSDERRAKERRQLLLDTLSTHDYFTPLKQSRRKRYSGTLEWLFQTPEFDRWMNNTDYPLLWCSGKSKFPLHYSYRASIFNTNYP